MSIDDDNARQAWLCAAGLRRDGSNADFYTSFQQACTTGSDHFLPTPEDRKRQQLNVSTPPDAVWRRLLRAQTPVHASP